MVLAYCTHMHTLGRDVELVLSQCVYAQSISTAVITELEQLHQILDFLGSPSEEFLEVKIKSEHARKYLRQMPQKPRKDPKEYFAGAHPLAIDLLEKMLILDPDYRISAVEALEHRYLADYHDPLDEVCVCVSQCLCGCSRQSCHHHTKSLTHVCMHAYRNILAMT